MIKNLFVLDIKTISLQFGGQLITIMRMYQVMTRELASSQKWMFLTLQQLVCNNMKFQVTPSLILYVLYCFDIWQLEEGQNYKNQYDSGRIGGAWFQKEFGGDDSHKNGHCPRDLDRLGQ